MTETELFINTGTYILLWIFRNVPKIFYGKKEKLEFSFHPLGQFPNLGKTAPWAQILPGGGRLSALQGLGIYSIVGLDLWVPSTRAQQQL